MKSRWMIATVFVPILFAGCTNQTRDTFEVKPVDVIPPVTITPGNETSLLPLDKGNQWVYSVQVVKINKGVPQPPQDYESVWNITDSHETSDGIEATISSTRPGAGTVDQKWRETSKGIYQLADGNPQVTFNPPFPLVEFPAQNGNSYTWKGTGPNGTSQGGKITSERTIRSSQVVDTDMGQMSAIPIDDLGTVQSGKNQAKSESTIWLTPGTGIVRLYQQVMVGDSGYVLTLKIKSKSLMKS